jgi:hypothetical protein
MFQSSEDLLAYIKKEGVEFVDVRFCDLPGIQQHFSVPVSSFGEEVFTDGLMFDGSSIRGFQAIHESDMSLMPDPTTAYIDPFRRDKTLALSFFIHDPLTGEAYSRDPATSPARPRRTCAAPESATPRSSRPKPSSTSSTTCASRPRPTPATTPSTPSRARGTPVGRRRAATRATRSATRAATSR